jgi:hypothetical protein
MIPMILQEHTKLILDDGEVHYTTHTIQLRCYDHEMKSVVMTV